MQIYLFTNDRKIKIKKVNPSKLWFNYRGKLYDIDPTAILMDEYADKEKLAKPRLIYFENSSEALKYSQEPSEDPTPYFMEKYLKLNSVRTQNKPSLASKIGPLIERVAGLFTLQNLIVLVIALSMAYSALQGAGYL